MYPGKWAKQKPNEPAVIHSVSGEQTSWKELDDRSNQLAQWLSAKGLKRGGSYSTFYRKRHSVLRCCLGGHALRLVPHHR